MRSRLPEGEAMSFIRRVIAVSAMVVAMFGATQLPAAAADDMCAAVKLWSPVGRQSICLPLL